MVTMDDLRILEIYLDHLEDLGIAYEQFPNGTYNLKCGNCRARWTIHFNPYQIPKITDDYYKCPNWNEEKKACVVDSYLTDAQIARREITERNRRLGIPDRANPEIWSRDWIMHTSEGREVLRTFDHAKVAAAARLAFRQEFFPGRRALPWDTIVYMNRGDTQRDKDLREARAKQRTSKIRGPRKTLRGYLSPSANAENYCKRWTCKPPGGLKEIHIFHEPVNEEDARRFFREKNYPKWKGLPARTKIEQFAEIETSNYRKRRK